jgi:hypothetical protein
LAIDVRLCYTVQHVKLLFELIEGILLHDQRLFFGGNQLEDDRSLESYGIRKHSTIYVLMRLGVPVGMDTGKIETVEKVERVEKVKEVEKVKGVKIIVQLSDGKLVPLKDFPADGIMISKTLNDIRLQTSKYVPGLIDMNNDAEIVQIRVDVLDQKYRVTLANDEDVRSRMTDGAEIIVTLSAAIAPELDEKSAPPAYNAGDDEKINQPAYDDGDANGFHLYSHDCTLCFKSSYRGVIYDNGEFICSKCL